MFSAFKSKLSDLFAGSARTADLPTATVVHDSVDQMQYRSLVASSERFKKIAVYDAPTIEPDWDEPPAPDFTTATPDEIKAWQEGVAAARAARQQTAPYEGWADLCRDYFYLHVHPTLPRVRDEGEIAPNRVMHRRIMQKTTTLDDFAQARSVTRDDPTVSAMAVMGAASRELPELLKGELAEQARQVQDFERAQNEAQDAIEQLESLRQQARDLLDQDLPIPQGLIDQITAQVQRKHGAVDRATDIAQHPIPFSAAAQKAIERLAKATREAAEAAQGVPTFGQGFGQGEPTYESPEQALSIAEAWAQDPTLVKIAANYGRFDPDVRFERSKRVVGGQDEIVDIEFGDNLRRALSSELGNLVADPILEDDFFARYLAGEMLQYTTVGEEHVGRGPIGLVIDGSYSMAGERNCFARAVALVILNIARREKRDCFVVEFASDGQVTSWIFRAKEALSAQTILDMASHFFGGGTEPLLGIQRGVEIMDSVPAFRKADLVLLTDGEARFNQADRQVRDYLVNKGVRIHGVGIGQTWGYLKHMCDGSTDPVHVMDFQLEDPNAATTALATHIT